jgi:hypothetical protein
MFWRRVDGVNGGSAIGKRCGDGDADEVGVGRRDDEGVDVATLSTSEDRERVGFGGNT